MDATPHSNSTNVTVEYTDPSNLFPLVQSVLLQARQLRNLHWKSPSRPLRSIGCLQIDYVPAQSAEERKRLSDGAHRRHQIPGLRRTPYLKLYLLRCDDNETYKATSRKLVREWVKAKGGGVGGGSQDNHDACEWLIIHVVEPSGPEPPEKAGPITKWPGRGSTSVFEKLRADFNGSSKNAVDRVVQLKIPKPGANQKSPELATQLEDLVAKFKSSILTSFDLRVAQYEEDIRGKDSQRSLPGWNFCTFFILKEGLALGFENVGLYEDSLIGYDELSVGLDAALRDQLSGAGDQHGGTLLAYSDEMKSRAEEALLSAPTASKKASTNSVEDSQVDKIPSKEASISDPIALNPESFPFNPHQKPYRDMIVANNISVFDFRAYIFSRQMQLLLKAAQGQSSGREGLPSHQGTQPKETYDLTLIAEICDRASEVIALASRTLRKDLENGIAQLEGKYDDATIAEVIDNIVYSWSYTAVSQVLNQTSMDTLDIPRVSLKTTKDLADASILTVVANEPHTGVPRRSSSLVTTPTGHGPPGLEPSSLAFGNNPTAKRPLSSLKLDGATAPRTGAIHLASARGDLYVFARRVLEALGRKRGWGQRWHALSLLFTGGDSQITSSNEICLDDSKDEPGEQQTEVSESLVLAAGIDAPVLKESVRSSGQFNICFEDLTDEVFRHYVAANRIKSAEIAIADMAILKYWQHDYATAASYFNQLAAFYGSNNWETLEGNMLELYARCLEKLDRKEDFVHTLLKLLGKHTSMVQRLKLGKYRNIGISLDSNIAEYMHELFETARVLPNNFTVRLRDFFTIPAIDPQISHFDDKDGFRLQMSLRYLLTESIEIDCVKVRLLNTSDIENNELWLDTAGRIVVKGSITKITLDSSTTTQGRYLVDRIELHAGNIIFTHGTIASGMLSPTHADLSPAAPNEEETRTFVTCYPRASGVEAKISHSSTIDLGGRRSIEIQLSGGSNTIEKGVIRLKPATAGLRLLVAETEIVNGSIQLCETLNSGQTTFLHFGPSATATLSVPYTMEKSATTIVILLEIEYQTINGSFLYLKAKSILTTLPVSVNVQDVFKHDALFSRFTISPAMMIPLRVLDCQMPCSQEFIVQSSMPSGETFDVFPKQPLSLVYEIKPNGGSAATSESGSRSLRLTIDFICLNEECFAVLENQFIEDLEMSSFSRLRYLLLPHLLGAFSSQWTTTALERISLLREVDVFPYEKMQWQNVTRTLGRELRQQVTEWLMDWHKQHPTLSLQGTSPGKAIRQITIPVDIPEIQVVYTAELVLHNVSSAQPHAAVGEAINAELVLRHTRQWCPEDKREPSSALEFMYEVVASPDIWLVGGRRRGNFTATEGQTSSFPLMLLPQRPGHLLLPHVELKAFVSQESHRDSQQALQRRQVPSEVDYLNHSVTVLVTPNLKKTTVSLDVTGASGSGAWLIDSEQRVIPTS